MAITIAICIDWEKPIEWGKQKRQARCKPKTQTLAATAKSQRANSNLCSSSYRSFSLCGSDSKALQAGAFSGAGREAAADPSAPRKTARGHTARQKNSDWLQETAHGAMQASDCPRKKDRAKKTCTGAHGQAEELGLMQGNHALRERCGEEQGPKAPRQTYMATLPRRREMRAAARKPRATKDKRERTEEMPARQ